MSYVKYHLETLEAESIENTRAEEEAYSLQQRTNEESYQRTERDFEDRRRVVEDIYDQCDGQSHNRVRRAEEHQLSVGKFHKKYDDEAGTCQPGQNYPRIEARDQIFQQEREYTFGQERNPERRYVHHIAGQSQAFEGSFDERRGAEGRYGRFRGENRGYPQPKPDLLGSARQKLRQSDLALPEIVLKQKIVFNMEQGPGSTEFHLVIIFTFT